MGIGIADDALGQVDDVATNVSKDSSSINETPIDASQSLRQTPDQKALLDLAKEAEKSAKAGNLFRLKKHQF